MLLQATIASTLGESRTTCGSAEGCGAIATEF
jgi:hypothetical protein